jgi:hypothetical protein
MTLNWGFIFTYLTVGCIVGSAVGHCIIHVCYRCRSHNRLHHQPTPPPASPAAVASTTTVPDTIVVTIPSHADKDDSSTGRMAALTLALASLSDADASTEDPSPQPQLPRQQHWRVVLQP